ncbi:hypothetical protein HDU81_004066 [Chytriomyces hyalinus]|nr:hypothetical protein HDU81_004066 [Chytriomyces hyalinus]
MEGEIQRNPDEADKTGEECEPSFDAVQHTPAHVQIEQLRSAWQFAAVTQFLMLFAAAVEYPFETTEDFETALAAWTPSPELIQMHVKLLRIMTYNRFVTAETWASWFRRESEKKGQEWSNLFPESKEYHHLTAFEKTLVLNQICEWQFDDPDRFRAAAKDEDECRHWRVDPLGWDSMGGTYWLFDDNRLYREHDPETAATAEVRRKSRAFAAGLTKSPPPELSVALEENETKPQWELVCRTVDDWAEFPKRFESSRSPYEKSLYNKLTRSVGLTVIQSMQDRQLAIEERKREKQRLEEEAEREILLAAERERQLIEQTLYRKRSSRLESRMLEQLERERLDMIERDARAGRGESVHIYDTGHRSLRTTRASAARAHEPPKDVAQLREERSKRRAARFGDSPIPEELLRKSMETSSAAPSHEDAISIDSELAPSKREYGVRTAASTTAQREKRPRLSDGSSADSTDDSNSRKKKDTGDSWRFKCSCGINAKNWDGEYYCKLCSKTVSAFTYKNSIISLFSDGLPMISCGQCNIWQHIYCIEKELGTAAPVTDGSSSSRWDSQEFVCSSCEPVTNVKTGMDGCDGSSGGNIPPEAANIAETDSIRSGNESNVNGVLLGDASHEAGDFVAGGDGQPQNKHLLTSKTHAFEQESAQQQRA